MKNRVFYRDDFLGDFDVDDPMDHLEEFSRGPQAAGADVEKTSEPKAEAPQTPPDPRIDQMSRKMEEIDQGLRGLNATLSAQQQSAIQSRTPVKQDPDDASDPYGHVEDPELRAETQKVIETFLLPAIEKKLSAKYLEKQVYDQDKTQTRQQQERNKHMNAANDLAQAHTDLVGLGPQIKQIIQSDPELQTKSFTDPSGTLEIAYWRAKSAHLASAGKPAQNRGRGLPFTTSPSGRQPTNDNVSLPGITQQDVASVARGLGLSKEDIADAYKEAAEAVQSGRF
ncbi:MAG: hypothetical protein KKB31_07380 [Nanoarchaeota archaeon]|nr:hypothetical protein [Nanoarchaeota archaeon]